MYDDDSFERLVGECLELDHIQNRKLIEEWCKEAGVNSPVGYHNELGKRRMTIYTDSPGYLIGKSGCLVDQFTKKLCKEFYVEEYEVKFVQIKGRFVNIK